MKRRRQPKRTYGRRAEELLFLLDLLKISSNKGEILSTISRLAELTGMSQQSVSRMLRSLASVGFVVKQPSGSGERILLASHAYDMIAQELAGVSLPEVQSRLGQRELSVAGTVFTGKGEGAYYVSQKAYFSQIQEKLGFTPYPGTLNLRLNDFEDVNKILLLHSLQPIRIKGFSTHERTFGDVLCHDVRIAGGPKVYLIRSERTSYDLTVVELVSDVYLRKALQVRDGDSVKFSFFVLV